MGCQTGFAALSPFTQIALIVCVAWIIVTFLRRM